MTNRRRKTSRKCKRIKKTPSCEERVGATGPGKSGLECSRYHDKVHVSCVGKAHLQYFEGYDDSDDDAFAFICTRCFRLDDNSSMDSESD